MAERDSAAAAGRAGAWFVQAAGRVWGPYPEARLEAFVAEGRVAAETLMSPSADGPFVSAARQARLRRLFPGAAPEMAAPVATPAPAPTAPDPGHGLSPARALLVWAGLRSQRPERFEQLLAAHGPLVRLGDDLWLVRARMGPAGLRNTLTRRLESADTLMVIEAPIGQAAWFNLNLDADRTMRQLWLEG